jgi:hypothetical protein
VLGLLSLVSGVNGSVGTTGQIAKLVHPNYGKEDSKNSSDSGCSKNDASVIGESKYGQVQVSVSSKNSPFSSSQPVANYGDC